MTTKSSSTFLIISLIINLVLIGLFTGQLIKRSNGPTSHRPPHDTSQFSEDQQQFAREFFEDAFVKTQSERTARAESQQAIHDALTADTIDLAEIEAMLTQLKNSETVLHTKLHQNVLDTLPQMTAAERSVIAGRLFARGERPPRRSSRNGPPGRRPGQR